LRKRSLDFEGPGILSASLSGDAVLATHIRTHIIGVTLSDTFR